MGHKNITKPHRVGFLDEVRGLDIIAMVLYHAGYDLVYIFGIDVPGYRSFAMPYIQPLIAGTFIVLSGISCRYSKSNAKRGVKTLIFGMVLTVVTLLFIPEEAIYFGILHFMGSAMLLFALLKPAIDTIPASLGMAVSIALFVFTQNLPEGFLGFVGLFTIPLPEAIYKQVYLLPLGFGGMGSDYFPLFPWIFLYFAGAYLGTFIVRGTFPKWFYNTHSQVLSKIGRNTIIIYMLHQPVLMGILWVFIRLLNER